MSNLDTVNSKYEVTTRIEHSRYFFFPREWRHCLFHTFSSNMSFCRGKGTSSVAEWLERLTAYLRIRVRLPAELRMRLLEEYAK